jgi:transglutaminase-like putative cysteine protease
VRFQRIQEIVLLAFAAIGLAVLALSGAAGLLASLAAPVAFVGALLVPRVWMESRRWQRGWTVVAVVAVGAALASAVAGSPLVLVTAQLAAYLQVHKLFNRSTSRDQEQIAFLALGHVAFATILLTGLKYALLLLAFVALAPLLLTLLHLRREIEQKYAGTPEGGRDDQTLARVLRTRRVATPGFVTALLVSAVPLLALTTLFFLALPRLGFGLLAGRMGGSFLVGFSDRMELGDLVPLADDPTPVLRVEFPDGNPANAELAGLHFRGATFDTYDGRSWRRTAWSHGEPGYSSPPAYGLTVPGDRPTAQFTVRVLQETFEPRLLFLPAGTRAFSFRGPKPRHPGLRASPLEWSADGTVSYREAGEEGVTFEALVGRWPDGAHTPEAGAWDPAAPDGDPYRSLPPSPQRLQELARRLTAGLEDPRARADAILRWLRGNFRYTRGSHADAGERPLEDFLFRWKEGYCEYFSSAMTLLARAAGLRARNVSGFLGGHWNNIGDYLVVRQSDAHSWAEVELPGEGWVVYDATPPGEAAALSTTSGFLGWLGDVVDALRTAWHRHIIAFDVPRQIGLLRSLGEGLRQIKDAVVAFARDGRNIIFGLLAAAALAAGLWAARRLWRRRVGRSGLHLGPGRRAADLRGVLEARRLLSDLERVLRSEGIERAAHEPAERLAERATRHGTPLADATRVAVHRYAAARFGGRLLRPADRRALVHDVARALRRN